MTRPPPRVRVVDVDAEPLLDIAFTATVIHWRGPAPFFFVAVPQDEVVAVREAAREASYGWGCVPVEATLNGEAFRTSLFPRDGGYMLPLKAAVRKATGVVLDDVVGVEMAIYPPRR